MCLLLRIWFPAKLFMERRESLFRVLVWRILGILVFSIQHCNVSHTQSHLQPICKVENTNLLDVLPIARKLGESVLESCTSKLKPYLLNAVKSLGMSPNDHSKIVASICQVASDTKEHNDDTVSKEHLDDQRSSHKKMGSDTPPQATQVLKPEVACPGEVDVVSEKSKQFTASNGDAQNVKDDSSGFVASPKKAECSQPAPQAGLVEPDSLDHKLAEAEDKTDQTSQ